MCIIFMRGGKIFFDIITWILASGTSSDGAVDAPSIGCATSGLVDQ